MNGADVIFKLGQGSFIMDKIKQNVYSKTDFRSRFFAVKRLIL